MLKRVARNDALEAIFDGLLEDFIDWGREWSGEVDEYMIEDAGGKLLGKGSDARVYKVGGNAVRVGSPRSSGQQGHCYADFADYVLSNKSERLPKIYRVYDGRNYYATEMEILEPMKRSDFREVLEAHPWLQTHFEVQSGEYQSAKDIPGYVSESFIPYVEEVYSVSRDSKKWSRAWEENVYEEILGSGFSEKGDSVEFFEVHGESDSLAMELARLGRAFAKCDYDVHSGNFMWRGGTLVISDPLW